MKLYAGLMSGTSMDGVDAALLTTDGEWQVQPLAHFHLPYPKTFQNQMKACEAAFASAKGVQAEVEKAFNLKEVIEASTKYHAKAINQLLAREKIDPKNIEVIGYHGQTVFHQPQSKTVALKDAKTIQLGDPKLLEKLTGCSVEFDFRSENVRKGGQGAPLAPLYHRAMIGNLQCIPGAAINCGGIANVSLILGAELTDVRGWDTGPGNVLIDRVVRQKTAGAAQMDVNGDLAKQGKLHADLLETLFSLHANFLEASPPKSLDTHQLILPDAFLKISLEDACHTLGEFTAQTIANAFLEYPMIQHVLLCGGGWYNAFITARVSALLAKILPDLKWIKTMDEAGFNSASVEAECFAYLAARRKLQLPIYLTRVIGGE